MKMHLVVEARIVVHRRELNLVRARRRARVK